MSDFDGCNITCRTAGKHTQVHGSCERAVAPEPTISLLVTVPGVDDMPAIAFDTYTVEGLADLIEPAVRNVRIQLGPNSLAAIRNGNTLTLTSGEVRALALEAAHAIIHRNDPK
jgi:hypothetical protein